MSAEEEEEGQDSGVPRRHTLFLTGSTVAATAGAGYIINRILGGEDNGVLESDDGDILEPDDTDESLYETWQDAIPEGCELPQEYESSVENHIDEIGMNSSELTDYVNNERVKFRRDGADVEILADTNSSGQYDHGNTHIRDICG